MGLLDSNLFKLLRQKTTNVVSNQSEAGSWNILTKGYKTIIFRVVSTASETISFRKGWNPNNPSWPQYTYFKVYSTTGIYDNSAVPVSQSNGNMVYIDVSDCESISIFKTGTSATMTIEYILVQSGIPFEDFLPALVEKGAVGAKQEVFNQSISTANLNAGTEIQCAGAKCAVLNFQIPAAELPARIDVYALYPGPTQTAPNRYEFPVVLQGDKLYQDSTSSGDPIHRYVTITQTRAVVYLDLNGASSFYVKAAKTISSAVTKYALSNEKRPSPSYYMSGVSSAAGSNVDVKSVAPALSVIAHVSVKSGTAKVSFADDAIFFTYHYYLAKGYDHNSVFSGTRTSGEQFELPTGEYYFYFDLMQNHLRSIAAIFYASTAVANMELYSLNNPIEDFIDTKKSYSLGSIMDIAKIGNYSTHLASRTNDPDGAALGALYANVAVFYKSTGLYISLDGVCGFRKTIEFNSTNFPGAIAGSTIERVGIIPWTRRTSSGASVAYTGQNWRIVVFTSAGQVYHNFPSRASGYDGTAQAGDEYLFDESVIWDSPERTFPTKTQSGDDAALIATGQYRYCPCLPDSMYEKHPAISSDNGYGNGGFPAVRSYNDQNGVAKSRSRFFVPYRGTYQSNSLMWMGGFWPDKQVTAVATYLDNRTFSSRMCVFLTNDGREWFVAYEYGPNSRLINESGTVIAAANNQFSQYGQSANLISFGSNSVGTGAYNVRRRSAYIPSASAKEPTHLFSYDSAIAVSGIVSSSSGIIVTTASAHGLSSGDTVIFEIDGGNANWDWIASVGHTQDSAGNGVLWRAQVITSTTFQLMLEVKNPYNPLAIRHIHTINRQRDGYIIGCGETYPNGWVEFLQIKSTDDYDNLFAGNSWPVYRLTSTQAAVQRILGFQFSRKGDDEFYVAMDDSTIKRNNIELPAGRTAQLSRNSAGIYRGKVKDIDSFADMECVFQTDEPAYFFKEVEGILVFVGQRGLVAISNDFGDSWDVTRLPGLPPRNATIPIQTCSWFIGVSDSKEIGIRNITSWLNDTFIIRCMD